MISTIIWVTPSMSCSVVPVMSTTRSMVNGKNSLGPDTRIRAPVVSKTFVTFTPPFPMTMPACLLLTSTCAALRVNTAHSSRRIRERPMRIKGSSRRGLVLWVLGARAPSELFQGHRSAYPHAAS